MKDAEVNANENGQCCIMEQWIPVVLVHKLTKSEDTLLLRTLFLF